MLEYANLDEGLGPIMSQIQGFAAHAAGAELLPFRYDPGKLGLHEVEIAISHCGVCHSDLHLIANDWGISQYPFIPGHEVVGAVTALGAEVSSLSVGQRVGLGWQSNSCGVCEWCTQGMENLCPAAEVEKAVTSAPKTLANWIAIWPNPPMPTIPTREEGLTPWVRIGL